MAVTDIDDSSFNDAISAEGWALVDFYGSWCGPCIMFKPIFQDMSAELSAVRFYKLDGEASPVARGTVKIPGLPFFALYKDGVMVEGIATSKEARLREMLGRHGIGGAA